MIRKASVICLMLLLPILLTAQITSIGGIINTGYGAITAINTPANSVTISNPSDFAIGDTVIVIQMKGATMAEGNNSSFGDISAVNSAGKYEINSVCDIQGNNVVLAQLLLNTYDAVNGAVQIVKVRTYQEVQITAALDAPTWNGSTGGVLAIQVLGTMRLKPGTAILMNGDGLRGGVHEIVADGCGCSGSDPIYADYFYSGPGNNDAALKGEGIANTITGKESGKGKQATAGGGGNDHNGGGGGGANYGNGGDGGAPCSTRSCFFGDYCRGTNPGIGGEALSGSYSGAENRIFMGSGGGAGDDNGGGGSGGTGGGGIVIIMADSIVGNSGDILVRGTQPGTGAGDGAGGGGAGGTVILDVRAFHPSNFDIFVDGGNGGVSSWSPNTYNSKGKGGGGGGGVVWHQAASLPPQIVIINNGGAAGSEVAAASACFGSTGGATAGGNGVILNNFSMPFNPTSLGSCVLPVEFAYFNANAIDKSRVRINWATTSEINNAGFEIQRSVDGKSFSVIGNVKPLGSGTGSEYSWTDTQPLDGANWYRIRQSDYDGRQFFTESRLVYTDVENFLIKSIYPNPVQGSVMKIAFDMPSTGKAQLMIYDSFGRKMMQTDHEFASGQSTVNIPTYKFAAGVYFLKLRFDGKLETRKFLVSE